jgi:hypothetical protein
VEENTTSKPSPLMEKEVDFVALLDTAHLFIYMIPIIKLLTSLKKYRTGVEDTSKAEFLS